MKPFLNVFRKFNEIDLEIPVLVLSTIPSASTLLIVASLYTLPLTVLKSSANASDTDSAAKIATIAFWGVMYADSASLLSTSQRQSDINDRDD